ncbi:pentatricopeptide repeat-containing protein At1g08070, chloroplastic-like [Fagus crenata]
MWLKHKGEMRREEQQYGAWLRAPVEKPVRRIEIKVAGRSNVPRWGHQPPVVTPVSPKIPNREAQVPDQLAQRVNEPNLGSEEITNQSPPIIVKSRDSGRDLDRDIREIDKALHGSTENLEVAPKQYDCNPAIITSYKLRDLENLHEQIPQGEEVDKAIEDLRNRVILQDILGTKVKGGIKFSTRRKNSGKENLGSQPFNNMDLNAMHEIKVQRETRGDWKRVPRVIAATTGEGGLTKLAGVKRIGDWVKVQSLNVHGKKKGRGYRGYPFTWENCRKAGANIQKRLDRAVASVSWMSMFTLCTIDHVPTSYSDHVPILLHTDLGSNFSRHKRRPRKFEEKWAIHPECEKIIQEVWDQANPIGSPMFAVCEKIKQCRESLYRWYKGMLVSST